MIWRFISIYQNDEYHLEMNAEKEKESSRDGTPAETCSKVCPPELKLFVKLTRAVVLTECLAKQMLMSLGVTCTCDNADGGAEFWNPDASWIWIQLWRLELPPELQMSSLWVSGRDSAKEGNKYSSIPRNQRALHSSHVAWPQVLCLHIRFIPISPQSRKYDCMSFFITVLKKNS